MKKTLLSILSFGVAVFMARCSLDHLAGGGTESTNGRIIGTLVEDDGRPAGQTRVMLIASDHDPVKDGPVPDSLTVTTDESGTFTLQVPAGGAFNIEAFQPGSGYRVLLTGITANRNDTVYVPVQVIEKPGAIKFIPTPADGSFRGYVYLPGTTRFAEMRDGNVLIDSVPAGFIHSMTYADTVDSTRNRVVAAGFTVSAGNTAVIANASVWKYSNKIRLNTAKTGADVSGTVTNFPVLIRLTENNFDFSRAGTDGSDLRFAKENGVPLPYEIERWDAVHRLAEVWVKSDTVYGNDSAQFLMMYWGNAGAVGESNGAAVFDTAEGISAVWHLDRGCGDATANRHDAATVSATDSAGLIGPCKYFDGSDSIKITGLLGSPSSFTLSAWAQLDSTGRNGSEIISLGDAAFLRADYPANSLGTGGALHLSHNDTVFAHVGSGQYLKQTGWHLVTLTHSETTYATTLYLDGMAAGVRTDPSQPIIYAGLGQNTLIGEHGNGKSGYGFFGRIDEARVYHAAIPADYIRLSYMNQRGGDRLVVFR
jgi:hypothetical protein